MDIPLYQIDAFTDDVFGGNPAAICPLDAWIDAALMQRIAAENNLAETAFFVPDGPAGSYALRWFTPTVEVDLCGHATLASAWLVFNRLDRALDVVRFSTRSGELAVTRDGEMLFLDFPAFPGEPVETPRDLAAGLGVPPVETLAGPNYMAVLDTEAEVRALVPDFEALTRLHPRGVIATAPGDDCDFVSRFFAPSFGIPEDPVTGSAHCMLTPYWAERLGKTRLDARQVSARGGVLVCEDRDGRVGIGGRAALFMEGMIRL